MKMHPVKSSNITHIGHKDNTLHVTYSSGHTYAFDNVSKEHHENLMKADSKGKHLTGMGIKGKKLEKK